MRRHISIFLGLFLAAWLGSSLSAEEDASRVSRYEVAYTDGGILRGPRITRDYFLAHGRSSAHLGEQMIFAPGKNIRRIRDVHADVVLEGPYLEFLNGDILPGRVTGVGSPRPGGSLPRYLLVKLVVPLRNYAGQGAAVIKVRADEVVRVVNEEPGDVREAPGRIRLRSKALLEVKAIRWRTSGVLALTAEGTQLVALDDIAELHVPTRRSAQLRPRAEPETGLPDAGRRAVLYATNGARLTTREGRMVRSNDYRTAVQPSWALEAIKLGPADIAEILYLGRSEISLTELPSQTLASRTMVGFEWEWRSDRSVRGARLDTGDRSSPIGVGMHAHTAVAFELPLRARSFTSWLGLDRAVGGGGCATAAVFVDDLAGKPIWSSGFLRGNRPSVRVGPLPVQGKQRLILLVDFGHNERPRGADPLDIRDEANWMDTIIDSDPRSTTAPELESLFPWLADWELSETDRARLTPTQAWDAYGGKWVHALRITVPSPPDTEAVPSPPLPDTPGVLYEYYEEFRKGVLPDFDQLTPTARGVIPSINLNIPGRKNDHIAVRFRSTLVVPRSGLYFFDLRSDDGSKLYVNNRLLVNNDGLHPSTEINAQIGLRKGPVPIQVEFFQAGSEIDLRVAWRGPGTGRQAIPPEAYNRTLTSPVASLDVPSEYVTLDPISLTRTLDVTSSNAWWAIYAGRGDDRVGDYRVEALVNDEVIQDMTGSSIDTRDLQAIRTAGGVWNLGPYAGNRVKLEVRITPTSYPGYELPSFYLDQLEVGPETARVASPTVAASLVGTWRLRGGKSALKKSYHNGLLSGGDGVLRLYSEGTVSTWLRLPSGIQKSGVGYLLNDPDGVVFDYVNGDWVRDKAQLSGDEQTLWVREEGDEESWSLVFTRSELSAFPDFAGSWELRASESKIHNNIHSGNMQNGAGRLSVGRDGAYSLRIQYPPDAEGRTKHTSATGQVVIEGGHPVFNFDDEAWTDDHGELSADKRRLTLREKGNGDQWTLVFSK